MKMTLVLTIAIAYLLGSVPFAYIVARLTRGIDIRQVGTGNVGAMNTLREVGILPGLAVLLLDTAKGSLAVLLAQYLNVSLMFVFLSGFAAVAGHSWPIFLGFRGGRGAATTLGVLLAVTPSEFGISFLVMLAIFLFTWSSGLAIGTGLALLPLVIWAFGREVSLVIYPLALSVFLILRNIMPFKRDLAKSRSLKGILFRRRPPPWRR